MYITLVCLFLLKKGFEKLQTEYLGESPLDSAAVTITSVIQSHELLLYWHKAVASSVTTGMPKDMPVF